MTISWKTWLIVVMVVANLVGRSTAAPPAPCEAIDTTIATANTLTNRGAFEAALPPIASALESCAGGQCPNSCQAVLYFTKGYIYQRWAGQQPEKNMAKLDKAGEAYEKALSFTPANPKIIANLALIYSQKGQYGRAEGLALQAAEVDPQQGASLFRFLGDLLLQQDQPEEAVAAYRRSLVENPADSKANQGLLNAYHRIDSTSAEMLMQFGHALQQYGLNRLAANALELGIRRSYRTQPQLADKILVQWADIRSQLGSVAPGIVSRLPGPEQWPSRGYREIHRLISREDADPIALDWWQETHLRRHIAALMVQAIAKRLYNTGKIEPAIAMLEKGLDIAPKFYAYHHAELKDRPIAELDIALDLAGYYHETNNAGSFQGLVHQLFNEKALAYANQDLSSIQRYHTVLGLIYSERRIWTSGWADNAIFQLEHALKTAQRRSEADPAFFQPQPELAKRLAIAYRETDNPKAGSVFGDAAMGYLDLDDLKRSEDMLREAKKGNISTTRYASITAVLHTRRQATEGVDWRKDAEGYPLAPAGDRWIVTPGMLDLDQKFLTRQKFKVLADLGRTAESKGNLPEARYFSAKALSAAVDQKSFVSNGDVVRIAQVEASLLRGIEIANREQMLVRGISATPANPTNVQFWSTAATTGAPQKGVFLRPEVLQIGTYFEDPQKAVAAEKPNTFLKIKDNKVTLKTPTQNATIPAPQNLKISP